MGYEKSVHERRLPNINHEAKNKIVSYNEYTKAAKFEWKKGNKLYLAKKKK